MEEKELAVSESWMPSDEEIGTAYEVDGLEDQGLVRAVVARPSVRRPNRTVDPNLAPCTVSPGAPQSIRWWPA